MKEDLLNALYRYFNDRDNETREQSLLLAQLTKQVHDLSGQLIQIQSVMATQNRIIEHLQKLETIIDELKSTHCQSNPLESKFVNGEEEARSHRMVDESYSIDNHLVTTHNPTIPPSNKVESKFANREEEERSHRMADESYSIDNQRVADNNKTGAVASNEGRQIEVKREDEVKDAIKHDDKPYYPDAAELEKPKTTNEAKVSEEAQSHNLRSTFSIGDKFLFQRELFGGDGELFQKTMARLGKCKSMEEVELYLSKHFKWDKSSDTYKLFNNALLRIFK